MSNEKDPTAIPIEVDPRKQRMSGVAIHGNKHFDVPIISEITENLWQGGCADGLVLPPKIQHVVSLYPWERYTAYHQVQSMLSVVLYDDLDDPDAEQIIGIAQWVNTCRKSGATLVHCQAGLNRSGLVAAVALMLDGWSAGDAINLLRKTRSHAVLCNPSFEFWLKDLDIASV